MRWHSEYFSGERASFLQVILKHFDTSVFAPERKQRHHGKQFLMEHEARIVAMLGITITAGLIMGATLWWLLYRRVKKPKEGDIEIAY
jgi:hypothetical protein